MNELFRACIFILCIYSELFVLNKHLLYIIEITILSMFENGARYQVAPASYYGTQLSRSSL